MLDILLTNFFLAGGVQNSTRKAKDKKDKEKGKDNSGPADIKKDKKNLALRGIRGFDF